MLVSFLAGSIMYQCSNDHEVPSWNWILVTLAFVATVAWLDLLGNECVAVLESIGTITGLTSTPQGRLALRRTCMLVYLLYTDAVHLFAVHLLAVHLFAVHLFAVCVFAA